MLDFTNLRTPVSSHCASRESRRFIEIGRFGIRSALLSINSWLQKAELRPRKWMNDLSNIMKLGAGGDNQRYEGVTDDLSQVHARYAPFARIIRTNRFT
jgi:hypothetical protein